MAVICTVDDTLARKVPAITPERLMVPLVSGESVPYANLDYAATTPCLEEVQRAVNEFLPWYASAHRGAGFASRVSTEIYERARERVGEFVDARHCDEVVFTRNTTDALNLLARSLPRHTSVVCLDTEHHAALLSWRGPHVYRIPAPPTCAQAVAAVDRALTDCRVDPQLLVVGGASNVTGEILPISAFVEVARKHDARIVVDAAHLAQHRRISLAELDVDYVALSGHKLYAPFGAGALVGRADWLRAAAPYLAGGGAARTVARVGNEIATVWHFGTQRHEAGSPNILGAYALGVACDILSDSQDAIRAYEDGLLERLSRGLAEIPGLTELRLFADAPERTGTVSFVVNELDPNWIAAVLSAEYGIGVRDGGFCAHIATRRSISRSGVCSSGALRASIGLGTAAEHVDRLIAALCDLVAGQAPRWSYARVEGVWAPEPDPRDLPLLR